MSLEPRTVLTDHKGNGGPKAPKLRPAADPALVPDFNLDDGHEDGVCTYWLRSLVLLVCPGLLKKNCKQAIHDDAGRSLVWVMLIGWSTRNHRRAIAESAVNPTPIRLERVKRTAAESGAPSTNVIAW